MSRIRPYKLKVGPGNKATFKVSFILPTHVAEKTQVFLLHKILFSIVSIATGHV
jgi:hypothetical protein